MGVKVVITKAQLEATKPCSSKYFENSPCWDGYQLVYEDIDVEVDRLAAIPGAVALKWLHVHGLIPVTNQQVRDAIKKAQDNKTKSKTG